MGTNSNGSRGVHRPALPQSDRPSLLDRVRSVLIGPTASPLDSGLARINERLGLNTGLKPEAVRAAAANIRVEATERMSRNIYYAPDMDGQAEPGEVVWIWAPSDGPDLPPRERAMLVIGRDRHTILGLLISPNPKHAGAETWLDIGAGEWDASGRQCWIRLDRVLEVSEQGVRRQGALFPQRRFERIANRLRNHYHWG
ncbi:hypothetical protein B842_09900 [Corynebacterium humireducens NBRC 106098 = DSM 45392]|uniref:PemK-like protein n=1 Tax=Corynebacterium humireducens NBRC 106098 = DSM 45392 TaxID=1223515 RepID=A0A0B5DDH5_9CORY|nr:type II toxin-antitoxin system PemK/MazF family toxin [Corynebacterium humireducens]AJE33829.1 hypothetical protein B842_09900 [Corynebacterium humireducens NBRC 106098 = DSM 45392]